MVQASLFKKTFIQTVIFKRATALRIGKMYFGHTMAHQGYNHMRYYLLLLSDFRGAILSMFSITNRWT